MALAFRASRPVTVSGALALATLLSGCPKTIPNRPPALPAPKPLPAAQRSVVALPVRLSLERAGPALDDAIPPSYDLAPVCAALGLACVRGSLLREPMRLQVNGDTLRLSTLLHYEAIGDFIGVRGTCGVPDNPKRRANVAYTTLFAWDTSWAITLAGGKAAVSAVDPCKIFIINVDVTGKAMDAMNRVVAGLPDKAAEKVKELTSVRARAETAWKAIQQPIALDTIAWVAIQPESIVVAPFVGRNEGVTSAVGILATPRVTLGRAPDSLPRTPLPALRIGSPGDSIHLAPHLILPFRELNALLAPTLVGQTRRKSLRFLPDPQVTITGTDVYGVNDSVVVVVKVDGTVRGNVYLLGHVAYDSAAKVVHLDFVDYALESRNLLLNAARWVVPQLLDAQVQSAIKNVSWDAGPRLRQLDTTIKTSLNGPLGKVGEVHAAFRPPRAEGPFTSDSAFLLVAHLDGTASLDVHAAGDSMPTGNELRSASVFFETQDDDKDAEEKVFVWIQRGGAVLAFRELGDRERWGDHENEGAYAFRLPSGLTRQNCSGLQMRVKKDPKGSATGKQWNTRIRGILYFADGEEKVAFQTGTLKFGDGNQFDRTFGLC